MTPIAAPRTPTLLPIASSMTDTARGALPSPEKQNDWTSVTQRLKYESRAARLACLTEVHGLIHSAIAANTSAPGDLLEEARQVRHAMMAAELGSHTDVSDLEARAIDSCCRIMMHLARDNAPGPWTLYGGNLGNAVFQTVSNKVVVPLLTTHLAAFADQVNKLSYDGAIDAASGFLRAFLELAGEERRKIAKTTASHRHDEFGVKCAVGQPLRDPLDTRRYAPWRNLVLGNIFAILTSAWKEFRTHHGGAQLQDFLPQREHANASASNFWSQGSSTVYLWAPVLGTNGGAFGAPADYPRVTFEFDWSVQNEPEKATTEPIVISKLSCEHIPQHEDGVLEASLAPAFLRALEAANDPLRLKDSLASIFYDLVRSSLFERGLASISEMTIRSMSALHGYTLEFSPDWQMPDHPGADQRALSEFDRDRFIAAAREHFILKPVTLIDEV